MKLSPVGLGSASHFAEHFFGPGVGQRCSLRLDALRLIGIVVYLYLRSQKPQSLDRMANEMAQVELAGEEFDPRSRATVSEVAPG